VRGVPHDPAGVPADVSLGRKTNTMPVSGEDARAVGREAVIVHMRAQSGPWCATCLSTALRTPVGRILATWADIRRRGGLPIRIARCAVCGTQAEVLTPPRT
jgi:hypothetical protein